MAPVSTAGDSGFLGFIIAVFAILFASYIISEVFRLFDFLSIFLLLSFSAVAAKFLLFSGENADSSKPWMGRKEIIFEGVASKEPKPFRPEKTAEQVPEIEVKGSKIVSFDVEDDYVVMIRDLLSKAEGQIKEGWFEESVSNCRLVLSYFLQRLCEAYDVEYSRDDWGEIVPKLEMKGVHLPYERIWWINRERASIQHPNFEKTTEEEAMQALEITKQVLAGVEAQKLGFKAK
ncbi:MAG: hypothetical protein J7K00_02735 [Candidatus Diapherotrites archaeon]|nr:hypothetical protein [Candidatus Diapherotrites archaeon]